MERPGQELRVFLRAARREADPQQLGPFQAGTGNCSAPRCEFALGLSPLLHLGTQEAEEVRLLVALGAAGLLLRARVAPSWVGVGKGLGNPSPVVGYSEGCNISAF